MSGQASKFKLRHYQVLNDLSEFIIPVNAQAIVQIRMRNFNLMGYTNADLILAEGRPFYSFPQPSFGGEGGIIDNLAWKTINSGQDAYADMSGPILTNNIPVTQNFFYGQLTVNFRDEDDVPGNDNISPIHWNLNTSTFPDAEDFDLYSVLLHEMFHLLGFNSLISISGNSGFTTAPYFTRYDSFLKKIQGNELLASLLATPSEPCAMYVNTWNANLNLNILNPQCNQQNGETVDCPSAIRFDGSNEVTVYHPGCFQYGSSLSHLWDECAEEENYQFFLMAPGFPSGISRRFPQDEEATIMCDLGYHINDHFGNQSGNVIDNYISYGEECGGLQVVGINDGIDANGDFEFVSVDGVPLTILGSDLLANDYAPGLGNLTFECLEVISGSATIAVNGNVFLNTGTSLSSITILPDDPIGTYLLRYVPVQNGIRGNITYVFAKSYLTPDESVFLNYTETDVCISHLCDLINNGGFEEDSEWCSHQCRATSEGLLDLTCWHPYGAPVIWGAYFTRTNMVDGTINCTVVNNNYIRPANNNAASGIGSNTRSQPATETHPYLDEPNNALIFIGAHKFNSSVGTFNEIDATRFRTLLNSPLIPGSFYKISYFAKVLKSNLDPAFTTSMIESVLPLYNEGNVPARVRFLIDNRLDLDVLNIPGEDLAINTALYPNTIALEEALPIEPVAENPTAASDWHYREIVVQVPEGISNDYQYLTIDYNIWDSPYEELITGVFIDDVKLEPYIGNVVAIPLEICSGQQLEDLQQFVLNPNIEGEFSCPQFPTSVVMENGIYVFHPELIIGNEAMISFEYDPGNGCNRIENNLIQITNCCTYVNATILQGSCMDLTVENSIILLADDNDNSVGDTDSFTFNWTSDNNVTIAQTTSNSSVISLLDCGEYHVAITNNELGCTDNYDYEILCAGEETLTAQITTHIGICFYWMESVVAGGTGSYFYDWHNQNSGMHYYTPDVYNPAPGVYILTVTDEFGCVSEAQTAIGENATENAGQISYSTECLFIPGSPIQFSILAAGENYTYSWDFGNGITSDVQNPLVSFESAESYTVTLVVSSPECGTISIDPVILTINDFDWPNDIIISSQSDIDTYLIDGNSYGGDIIFTAYPFEYLIENITLYLGPESDIIIEEDAFLKVDNCVFTSCSNWGGIDLRSYSETSENASVMVMLDCLVSHARIAVQTRDLTDAPGNNEAGIFHIQGTTFLNNLLTIRVFEADHPTTEISEPYILGVMDCHFKVDDDLKNHFDQDFRYMVSLNRAKYYNFTSCDFENAMQEVAGWSERGEAIHGLDAKFFVDDVDTNEEDAQLSWFKGFAIAIDVSVLNGAYNHMMVRETDFTQNRIAIFNRNVCFQRLVKNDIILGESTGLAALDDETNDYEGIVLDGGGFYRVSGNEMLGEILSNQNDGATIGIRIRDNITQNQEVNNNEISFCDYAMLANGNNSINNSGLRYVCNQFTDNTSDIFVGEFPGNGNLADISQWQSDLGNLSFNNGDKAAGNHFSNSPPEWNFYNNAGGQEINYLYFDDNGGPQTPVYSGNIVTNNQGQPNLCELTIMDEFPMEGNTDPTLVSSWESAISLLKADWQEYQYIYTATIDDGNTDELMDIIDGMWNNNIWMARQKMLNTSPYLSEGALLELADNMPTMPYLMSLEIFLANPSVTTQPGFLHYLKANTDMPEEMIEMIGANTNRSIFRDMLVENLAKSHMRLIEANSFLLQYKIHFDLLTEEDLVVALGDIHSLYAEFLICDLLLDMGLTEDATARFADIMKNLNFTELQMGDDVKRYNEWLGIASSIRRYSDIISEDMGTLEYLAGDKYFTVAGKKAAAVLNEFFDGDHFIPAYYNDQIAQPRGFTIGKGGQPEVHFMQVNPNPANEFVQIQLNLTNPALTDAKIEIRNSMGALIQQLKVNTEKQFFIVDLTSYSAGEYNFVLSDGNRVLEKGRLIVVH